MSSPVRVSVDKKRANELLRYAIGILQGKNMITGPKGRLEVALVVRGDLEDMGAWWQVQILQYWIHRAQGGELPGS